MILKTTTRFIAVCVFTSAAFATTAWGMSTDPSNAVEAQGKINSDTFVNSAENSQELQKVIVHVQYGLNTLVAEGISQLQQVGETATAAQLQQEWNQNFSAMLLNVRNLGDHRPLNEWLGNFTKLLLLKVGEEKMRDSRMYDLFVYNFGIPVVIHPRGNAATNEVWDKGEYAKHFVPVFSSTVYWGSYGACLYAAAHVSQDIKPYCKQLAKLAEKISYAGVAARLSDVVYDKAVAQH